MLQRNVSGSPLVLPTLDPPAEVPPDCEIDHPELLAGFELVKPVRAPKSKAAASAASAEEATSDSAQ